MNRSCRKITLMLTLAVLLSALIPFSALAQPADSEQLQIDPVPAQPAIQGIDDQSNQIVIMSVGDKFSVGSDVIIGEHQVAGDIVVMDGDARVLGRVEGDIIVIGGNVRIDPTGQVVHGIGVVGGSVQVDGSVMGNVQVIGGNLTVLPEGEVRGNADVFGGVLTGSIGGNLNQNTVLDFSGVPMLSGPQAILAMMVIALIAHLIWCLAFPGATMRLSGILDQSPGPVVGVGLLTMLAFPAFLVITVGVLFATVIGIPLGILLVLSPFFLFTLGWTGLTAWLGGRLLALMKVDSRSPALKVTVGTIAFHVLLLLPLPPLRVALFAIGLIFVHGMLTLTRLGVRYDWDLPVYCAPPGKPAPPAAPVETT